MTHFLVLIDVGYRKKDTRFLNVAKLIINCRAENKHLRRQIHIGVDKRRDIDAMAPDMAVENLIVLAECRPCEDVTHLVFVDASIERMQRIHEAVVVVKIFVKKIQDHVAAFVRITWIHRHLAEKILQIRIDHRKRAESVPQVVERKESLDPCLGRLQIPRHNRAPKLKRERKYLIQKLL